jgi:hypothetical protein
MSRQKNKVDTDILKISTTPIVKAQLTELIMKGWYGKTENEIAGNLLGRQLEQLAKEGILEMPRARAASKPPRLIT